jgi:hypothetical protein
MRTRKPTLVIRYLLIEGGRPQALAYQARIAADPSEVSRLAGALDGASNARSGYPEEQVISRALLLAGKRRRIPHSDGPGRFRDKSSHRLPRSFSPADWRAVAPPLQGQRLASHGLEDTRVARHDFSTSLHAALCRDPLCARVRRLRANCATTSSQIWHNCQAAIGLLAVLTPWLRFISRNMS